MRGEICVQYSTVSTVQYSTVRILQLFVYNVYVTLNIIFACFKSTLQFLTIEVITECFTIYVIYRLICLLACFRQQKTVMYYSNPGY